MRNGHHRQHQRRGSIIKGKILITESLPLVNKELELLKKHAKVMLAETTNEDYLVAKAVDIDILMVVYCRIGKRLIDSAKRLKGIVRYGIGLDNIDVEAATRRGIMIANVPDYCLESVADHALALIMGLNRKLLPADRLTRSGQSQNTWVSPPLNLRGMDLRGKTLGIIGLGKIGRSLAAKARALRLHIIAYDPMLTQEMVDEYNIKLVCLNDLLSHSDFISIHAPLLPNTFHLIGRNELSLMKKTAFIVNVARGPIIDEKALHVALKEKWIAGAALDVYEREPPDIQNPLFKLDNTLFTPHIAWYTEEALHTLEMSAVNEAIRILNGELPRNLANREALSCAR